MVRIRIPASTSNLGCGYDTFGMALGYYNYIEASFADAFSLSISGEGAHRLQATPANMVARAAAAAYELAEQPLPPIAFRCENNIPTSRGLGSSSAAIVGGIFAANQLMGETLSKAEMLALAARLEGHPDNVASALYGGFTVTACECGRLYCKSLPLPASLRAVIAVPDFLIPTKKARSIMPKQVGLEDAVYNVSHAAYLALSLAEGDLGGFGAMLFDRLHQPYRATLIQGAKEVMEAAIAAGAIGCVISGSGPSMISFSEDDAVLNENIAAAMREAFQQYDVDCRIIGATMDNRGTIVV